MAFKDKIPNRGHQKYWKPEVVGECIEGNFCEISEDSYGNDLIVLEVGTDEKGKPLKTILPAHYGIKIYYDSLEIGEYLRIEFIGIKDAQEGKNPQKVYRVQSDPDKFRNYEG